VGEVASEIGSRKKGGGAVMKKEKRNTVVIERGDLSEHGLDLGIWDALTEGLPPNTEQVEILVLRKFA
jgi:hypothetical protein